MRQHPDVYEEMERIYPQLTGGCMAVVALILGDRLFIANIGAVELALCYFIAFAAGTARALLCRSDLSRGRHEVTQLSVMHNLSNPDERVRLQQLGLTLETLNQSEVFKRRTRCFGNYRSFIECVLSTRSQF